MKAQVDGGHNGPNCYDMDGGYDESCEGSGRWRTWWAEYLGRGWFVWMFTPMVDVAV